MGGVSRSAAITGTVALVLGGAGAAYGLARSSGTITVCVKHKGGALYQASRCASGDKKLSWGAAGAPGPQGSQGPQGAAGAAGAIGAQGPKGDTGAQGIQGIQGIQGVQGIQGIQGVPGVVGALSDLNGVGCTVPEGSAGTVTVSVNDAGTSSVSCVPTLGGSNGVPSDGLDTSLANPLNLGTLSCGGSANTSRTTSPAGDEDWIRFTTTCPTNGLTIKITPDSGIAFDEVDSAGNALQSDVTTQLVTPAGTGTYEIVVYGGAGVTGHYTITLTD